MKESVVKIHFQLSMAMCITLLSELSYQACQCVLPCVGRT